MVTVEKVTVKRKKVSVASNTVTKRIVKKIAPKTEVSLVVSKTVPKYEVVDVDPSNDNHLWIAANRHSGIGAHRSTLAGCVKTYYACHADIMYDIPKVRNYVGGFKTDKGENKKWFDLLVNLPVYKSLFEIPGTTLIKKDKYIIGYTLPDEVFSTIKPPALVTAFLIDQRIVNEYEAAVDATLFLVDKGIDPRVAYIVGQYFRTKSTLYRFFIGYNGQWNGGHQSKKDVIGCICDWGAWMNGDITCAKSNTNYQSSSLWTTSRFPSGGPTLLTRLDVNKYKTKSSGGSNYTQGSVFDEDAIVKFAQNAERVIREEY